MTARCRAAKGRHLHGGEGTGQQRERQTQLGLSPGLRDTGRARQPVAVNLQDPWHTSKVKRSVDKVDG